MEDVLKRAKNTNPTSTAFFDYHQNIIQPKLIELQGHLEHIIFDRIDDISAAELFDIATDVIRMHGVLYDDTAAAFIELGLAKNPVYMSFP